MSALTTLSGAAPEIVEAGVSGLGTMLVIAGIALVSGLFALWLSRRNTHREREHQPDQNPPQPPGPTPQPPTV